MAGYEEEFFTIDEKDKKEKLIIEQSTAVLLSDVIDDILMEENRTLAVVMKMDIEFMECKALLGSRGIFQNSKARILYR